jgi:dihydroflavonol-4-reductase
VVYTSSVATLALRADGSAADEPFRCRRRTESAPTSAARSPPSGWSRRWSRNEALPAVIVNPSTPIGPRDVKPTPTGRIIVEAARGRMPGFLDTGLNLVHVDDVAAGHLAALERGAIGERYILGGENVLLADMLADIARLVGRRPPRLRFPRAAVIPFAYAAEATARLTGRAPFTTRDGIRMAEHRMFFTAAKAERDLGFRAAAVPGGARGRDPLVPRGRLSRPEAAAVDRQASEYPRARNPNGARRRCNRDRTSAANSSA